MRKKIILSFLASSILFASNSTTVPTDGSNLNLTIYNHGVAFINDTRDVNIDKGFQKIIFEGIPKNVISESVIPTFKNINVNLYSQNYIYNVINQRSMLNYSIDSDIEFYGNNYLNQEEPQLYKGKLLAISPIMIKRSDNKIVSLNNSNQIIFNSIPEGMITKPSLIWNIEAEKAGKVNIDLKYLSTGISWNSDYVLNLNEDTLDLNGWITIKNTSGVDYKNATITCLAGEVHRAQKREAMYDNMIVQKSMSLRAMPKVKEESFSGYHIYKIPFKDTINNKQNKQIAFINNKNVKYTQYGINSNQSFENYGERKLTFSNVIEFVNSKENNMGTPLPQGKVNMYKKDSDGKTHFIGADNIGNIPNKEKIKLTIGTLFDVVGTKKITKYKANKYERNVETTYEIRNRGKKPITIKLNENIPVYGNKIKFETSCSGNCSYKDKTAFNREFTIKLDKGEVYDFTTEFLIRYRGI